MVRLSRGEARPHPRRRRNPALYPARGFCRRSGHHTERALHRRRGRLAAGRHRSHRRGRIGGRCPCPRPGPDLLQQEGDPCPCPEPVGQDRPGRTRALRPGARERAPALSRHRGAASRHRCHRECRAYEFRGGDGGRSHDLPELRSHRPAPRLDLSLLRRARGPARSGCGAGSAAAQNRHCCRRRRRHHGAGVLPSPRRACRSPWSRYRSRAGQRDGADPPGDRRQYRQGKAERGRGQGASIADHRAPPPSQPPPAPIW